jgi:hypothetical protein
MLGVCLSVPELDQVKVKLHIKTSSFIKKKGVTMSQLTEIFLNLSQFRKV